MNKRFSTKLGETIFVCLVVVLSQWVYGCSASNEEKENIQTEINQESPSSFTMDIEISEIEPDEEQNLTVPESHENMIRVGNYYSDYEDLEKNHKILSYDICSSPGHDYENTPLAEYIEGDISWNEDMSKRAGKNIPVEIDYHVFDFNNDGVEDYLLCESGRLFEGNGGDSVDIFIQEEEGVRNVLSTKMILHHGPHDHASVIVLDE